VLTEVLRTVILSLAVYVVM